RAARGARDRAHGRRGRELERRPDPRLVDRQRVVGRGDARRDDARERRPRRALLRGDRGDGGGDRERAPRRPYDDRPRRRHRARARPGSARRGARTVSDPQGLTFDSAAADYERGRTGWPREVLDGVEGKSALDLAAGTGKLT